MISSPKDDANKNPKHNIGWSFKDVGSTNSDVPIGRSSNEASGQRTGDQLLPSCLGAVEIPIGGEPFATELR